MNEKALISLTYDGSLSVHLSQAVPQLEQHGFRGTFFAYPPELVLRVAEWRACVASGHELGNGLLWGAVNEDGLAPSWPRETYEAEFEEAEHLLKLVGCGEPAFAYPCIRPIPAEMPNRDLLLESAAAFNLDVLAPLLKNCPIVRESTEGLNLIGAVDPKAIRCFIADGLDFESLCLRAQLAIRHRGWAVYVFNGLQDSEWPDDIHRRFLAWLSGQEHNFEVLTFSKAAAKLLAPLKGKA